jgi:ubiquinone/menaquinone biosynthesis C-methylase UbiE
MSDRAPSGLASILEQKPPSFFSAVRHDRIYLLGEGHTAAVLELSCGSGATGAVALRDGKCAKWVGVESDADAAAKAREVLTDALAGDVEALELPYPEGSFDILFMGERLPYFTRPQATLAKLVRLLRRGGRLFIAAEGEPLPAWLTPGTLDKLLTRAGLGAIEVRAAADESRRGLFQRQRYLRLEVSARRR